MATVTLNQTTDMSALPTLTSTLADNTNFEIDTFDHGDPSRGGVYCLGSFSLDPFGPVLGGTISGAQIDDGDPGRFPNLDITGLSFSVTNSFWVSTIISGHILDFTAALLAGDDTVTGTVGSDQLLGFDGNDTLIGGPGADVLDGDAGSNTASYATAATGVVADLDNNAFGTGDARGDIYLGIQNLTGSAFDDILYGNHGDNRLSGGAGPDILVGESGADTLDGGAGIDTAAYDASPAGLRADLLMPATNTGDAAGDSYISIENLDGSSFDDFLYGDNKANIIGGNLYHDTPSGNDWLYGRGGNDTLFGYDGDDSLDGGFGDDRMTGGPGDDVYYVDNVNDKVIEAVGGGQDTVVSAITYTLPANVETLRLGGTGNINGTGNAAANAVIGNTGNNVLAGGAGNDTLRGGGGRDAFLFNTPLSAATNVDHITDFTVGTDTIRLDHRDFAALAPGRLPTAAFYSNPTNSAAHDSSDRIVYDAANGGLYYDANGNASGGATQFATLSPHLAPTAGDFFIA
ncbi:MAG TPA: calcium-binding protein [Stellaceae bacterium]|nr:calcium-binding protein [Stellaceae bacterium]